MRTNDGDLLPVTILSDIGGLHQVTLSKSHLNGFCISSCGRSFTSRDELSFVDAKTIRDWLNEYILDTTVPNDHLPAGWTQEKATLSSTLPPEEIE